jgi:hypothetical protein
MATTIKLKNGSGAPAASDLVQGEPAFDLTNKRLYTENGSGAVIEVGSNPSSLSINGTAVTATAAEINVLDGITSSTAELNILDGVTATTAELNFVDGVTSNIQTQLDTKGTGTVSSLSDLGVTASAAELNLLDGVTATTTEINYLDGVTSNIQTQLNAAGGTVTLGDLGVTATAAELNTLDGITSTTAELNILDGVTSTAAELNILDGVTATAAELNILDGVTSTAAELNLLDGVTATTAELNYTDGVTSNIQTQLDAKQALDADLTAIAALSNADGNFIVGDGSAWVVESGATARTSLGLAIGSDVLAYDSNLQSFVAAFTLPTSDGSSGQALVTNGSGTISFGNVDALPSQSGNSGYYLTTDGSSASWDNLKASPTFTGIVTFSGTDAVTLPVGTTGQRPTAAQGMIRYNTTTSSFEGYNGSAWGALGAEFAYTRTSATATASQTTFSATYTAGYVDVYLNGVKLVSGTDFTATNGTSVVLATGATVGDNVEILAYETFSVANALTAANNLSDLSSAATALTNLGITSTAAELNILDGVTATTAELNYVDGVTSNIQTQIDNISPSPTLTATASGALANGDTVIVNSNGTVSAVSGSTTPETTGTAVAFESARADNMSCAYDANAQKVVVAYTDVGNSNYGTAVVGTVSGTSISFGTPVVFIDQQAIEIAATYDANAQKVVIAYRAVPDDNKGTAIVGTVSGTSISFGTKTVFSSGEANAMAMTYDANAQKVVIAYRDATNNYGTCIVGTVSGTSISFGSAQPFEVGYTSNIGIAYDANAQKSVVAYRDGGNSNYGTSVVGTISGTSISFGSHAIFSSADCENIAVVYDSSAQKVVVACRDNGTSGYGVARVGTISGTSISFGTGVNFETAVINYTAAVYDANSGKVAIAYRDTGNSDHGTVVSGVVSGTSISFSTPIVFESADTRYIGMAYDSNAQKSVIAYSDEGNSDYGTGIVYQTLSVSTNLTAENYIGISNAAYSDGATATIQIVGAVDDAQSSLTAGQQYFVQTNGSLGLTAADPSVIAGTAVSATKLIIKG